MPKLSIVLTALALIAAFSLRAEAASSCSMLFGPEASWGPGDVGDTSEAVLDHRFGRASQLDPELLRRGLITNDDSQLCGQTCMYNAVAKLARGAHNNSAAAGDAAEVAEITTNIFSDKFAPSKVVTKGLTGFELRNGLLKYLRQKGIEATVELRSTHVIHDDYGRGFPLSHLRESTDSNTAVIANLSGYGTTDPLMATPDNRLASHYVIVKGYDRRDPNRFFFSDPRFPDRLVAARLRPVQPPGFYAPAYLVEFENLETRSPVILLANIIVIRKTNGANLRH